MAEVITFSYSSVVTQLLDSETGDIILRRTAKLIGDTVALKNIKAEERIPGALANPQTITAGWERLNQRVEKELENAGYASN